MAQLHADKKVGAVQVRPTPPLRMLSCQLILNSLTRLIRLILLCLALRALRAIFCREINLQIRKSIQLPNLRSDNHHHLTRWLRARAASAWRAPRPGAVPMRWCRPLRRSTCWHRWHCCCSSTTAPSAWQPRWRMCGRRLQAMWVAWVVWCGVMWGQGKDGVTVEHVLKHQAGLQDFSRGCTGGPML